jgi:glucan phosphoethanolaminetransferase (alkaline phosphatase superfamily)
MIQRKQTVFLLLTTILSVLFLSGFFLSFEGANNTLIKISSTSVVTFSGEGNMTVAGKVLPLTIIIFLIPLTAIISVFLYRNRKIQMLGTAILTVFCIVLMVLSVYYSWLVMTDYNASYQPGYKSIIPFAQLILSFLAFRGIRSDDRLVKSYDRLR